MKQRVWYLDNLRIFLTLLVVAHHWAISNGAPGDTYYSESHLSPLESLLMGMFVATNQAFFMGFFFFLSGYFVPPSYKKKGAKVFIKDRLIRLGIPMIFYVLCISPVLRYSAVRMNDATTLGFWEYIQTENVFSVGVMWFVGLLLIFSLIYVLLEPLVRNLKTDLRFNRRFQILLFLALILATFLVRISYPVGDWLPVLGVQPAHLMQYILCFSLGIWAQEQFALKSVSHLNTRNWLILSQLLILIGFPMLMYLGGAMESIDPFMGGFTLQSFGFVLWEQFVALALILGLLGLFQKRFNFQNTLLKELSVNSYAIYVFHGLVLTAFSAAFLFYEGDSFLKFLFLLIPVLLFCYYAAKVIRSIPGIQKVL